MLAAPLLGLLAGLSFDIELARAQDVATMPSSYDEACGEHNCAGKRNFSSSYDFSPRLLDGLQLDCVVSRMLGVRRYFQRHSLPITDHGCCCRADAENAVYDCATSTCQSWTEPANAYMAGSFLQSIKAVVCNDTSPEISSAALAVATSLMGTLPTPSATSSDAVTSPAEVTSLATANATLSDATAAATANATDTELPSATSVGRANGVVDDSIRAGLSVAGLVLSTLYFL